MNYIETKTKVDEEYSPYSNFRDNSLGRVLHYIYIYLGLHYAEEINVGNSTVYFRGKTVASIDFSPGYPLFDFHQIDSPLNHEQIIRVSLLQRKYLDT